MARSTLRFQILEAFRIRMYFFLAIVALLFVILIIQIINIQLVQGSDYKLRSRMNMENNVPIIAPRGEIYDRNFRQDAENVVLASNRPSFNLTTIPARFSKDELKITMKRLSKLIDKPYDEIMLVIKEQNPWERIVLKDDVAFTTIVKIASHRELFPNIDWDNESVRVYNLGEILFHSIGYVGSISREEYLELRDKGYKYYQKIGKIGIESQYDDQLRGVDGFLRRIVDVRNRVEGEEVGLEPIAGNNLVLTIDSEIQTVASRAMEGQKGAVVVIKPSTGELLSLVSKPDADPNLIISRDNKEINTLINDPDKPFLNRAIQEKHPPASIFKLVTAISALEEEKVNPGLTYNCPGYYILKGLVDTTKYCYKIHGYNDLFGAIAQSCSVYFYQLGLKTGPTVLFKYADYLGLDEKSGIDIPGEITGFIPSKEWKRRIYKEDWYDGDTVNLSIGQGFIEVTAMEFVNMISCIVNNGIVYRPHLVKEIRSPDNLKILKTILPEKINEIFLSERTLYTIKTGMRESVKSGTARRLSYLKFPVAGKTGTAQTVSKRKEDKSQHAWFVTYGPYDADPRDMIAIVVLVEYGITGATTAVPVAEQIYLKLSSLGYI